MLCILEGHQALLIQTQSNQLRIVHELMVIFIIVVLSDRHRWLHLVTPSEIIICPLVAKFLGNPGQGVVSLEGWSDHVSLGGGQSSILQEEPSLNEVWEGFCLGACGWWSTTMRTGLTAPWVATPPWTIPAIVPTLMPLLPFRVRCIVCPGIITSLGFLGSTRLGAVLDGILKVFLIIALRSHAGGTCCRRSRSGCWPIGPDTWRVPLVNSC